MIRRIVPPRVCAGLVLTLAACAGTSLNPQSFHPAQPAFARRASIGPGPVITTSDAGEIFGFDIDQNGHDGLLSSWSNDEISVQAFDTQTDKITKTFGVVTGKRVQKGDDYVIDGIFAGDVGLVDFQKAGIPGKTPTKDTYRLANPVTHDKLNGKWVPPLKLFNVTNISAGAFSIQPVVPAANLIWDASQLAVNGTLRVTTPVPTGISGVGHLNDGNVGFTITGVVGQAYSIRGSNDPSAPVASWPVLQSGTLPSATCEGSKKKVTFWRNALKASAPATATPARMPIPTTIP